MNATDPAGVPSTSVADDASAGDETASAWGGLPTALVVLGVGLLTSLTDRWLLPGVDSPPLLSVSTAMTLSTTLPFIIAFCVGGLWLRRGSLPVERFRRIGMWTAVGSVGFFGLNLAMIAVWPPDGLLDALGWARFAFSVGGVGGLAVGITEARSIQRGRTAERARVRAEVAEERRERLSSVNQLLRHEVLNAANVVAGNAALLLEQGDLHPDARDRVETVAHHTDDIEHVVRDVRVLIEAAGPGEFARVDLRAVLEEEAEAVRGTHPDATVTVTAPETLPVHADDLIGRLFSNLLSNAVEHADDPVMVRITAEQAGDHVSVRVADDGPGIDEATCDALFEPERGGAADHGLGLHIVSTLAKRYGGSVELTDNGPDGAVFTVALPLADVTGLGGATGDDSEATGASGSNRDDETPARKETPPV